MMYIIEIFLLLSVAAYVLCGNNTSKHAVSGEKNEPQQINEAELKIEAEPFKDDATCMGPDRPETSGSDAPKEKIEAGTFKDDATCMEPDRPEASGSDAPKEKNEPEQINEAELKIEAETFIDNNNIHNNIK
ncbi:uncharacterized protein LOC126840026 isoform X1 [Adelges cooleyi]|uniref:uncharacterized protein LOC126840026 isoform X1 n=1 Tax=Adelges cooleyi TaxID=133065 RepID=UPI00217F4FF4|nr:uncharacterized protein LOC126840026 isoform X1 [Adelges cooleyi]